MKPVSANQYLKEYISIKYAGTSSKSADLILEMKNLSEERGDSFITELKTCVQEEGLLNAYNLNNLIYRGKNNIVIQMISAGLVDLSSTFFHMNAPDEKATLKWYAESRGAYDIVAACDNAVTQKLVERLNISEQASSKNDIVYKNEDNIQNANNLNSIKNEETTLQEIFQSRQQVQENINSTVTESTNSMPSISSVENLPDNSKVKIEKFCKSFQDAYMGELLNGGGGAAIYALHNNPNKLIRISKNNYYEQTSNIDIILQNSRIYQNACKLSAFKHEYSDLPVAQIDDIFFIHTKKRIDIYKFNKEDSAGLVDNAKDEDFYYMATIMERLIDHSHPIYDSQPVINAMKELNKHKIVAGDFKERNIVKKNIVRPYTDEFKSHLEQSQISCSEVKIENGFISYEVPIFIDYDDWEVPAIGENI